MSDQEPKKLKRLTPRPPESSDVIRVLYVEDADVIRDTLSRLLELNGFKVAYAKNGREGIELAIRWKPDVILMDLRMPVMDGYKAITELKMDARTKQIPVFVVSAWSSNTERTQAKLAGAAAFFVKPPDLNKLITAIQEIVGVK